MVDLGLFQVQLAVGPVEMTQQDYRTPGCAKVLLSEVARWRYASLRYDNPWELAIAQKFIRLRDPKTQSL
jgi:anaerobic magnesium-protoporphyrin IX monomethyl ester cyclase